MITDFRHDCTQFLYERFKGLHDGDLLHAVIVRTFMRFAGIAGEPPGDDYVTVAPGPPLPFVSRTKERDYGNAHSRGHVHGTRVDAEKKVRRAIYGKIGVQAHRPAKVHPIERAKAF